MKQKRTTPISPTLEQHDLYSNQGRMIRLDSITGTIQLRAKVNEETIARYADAYRPVGADALPPIVVFDADGQRIIADGNHRWAGAQGAKLVEIRAIVKTGDVRAATEYALESNHDHGLQLTNADKRAMVKRLLDDDTWAKWSDREISRRCRVSPTFVGELRAKTPKAAAITTRKDKHGKERKTKLQKTVAFIKEAIADNKPPPRHEVLGPQSISPADVTRLPNVREPAGPAKQAPLKQRRVEWMREHIAAKLLIGKVGACSMTEAAALSLIVGVALEADTRWSNKLLDRVAGQFIEAVALMVSHALTTDNGQQSRLPDLPDLCRIYKIDHDALVINAERTVTE